MIIPKILIVEDELLIAKDISLILEQEGYETRIGITNIEEAIQTLTEEEFVMVLIDVNLSNNSDGVELGAYLLKKDILPYAYITSHSDNVTIDRIKDTRPHGIIIKPFKAIDIKSTVSIILSNYKLKNIDFFRNEKNVIENEIDDVPFILKNVIEYINSNIHQKIDVIELSSLTKWSHHHFIKTFTKYINQTPYQYILKKKIEKSKALIRETDIPLSAIALDLGFSSYSNFCNAFKKEIGKTPDIFRKIHNMNK
jgi:AraC-like DNA-binding protein/CheY-like chemotaxis protein